MRNFKITPDPNSDFCFFCRFFVVFVCVILFSMIRICSVNTQSEVMAWGNLTGIRVDGQLMQFESSLSVVEKGWMNYNATARERQRQRQSPKYDRDDQKQTSKK